MAKQGEHGINWTDYTFSPWEGCSKVSPGCKNCYAEARDRRLHRGENWGPDSTRLVHGSKYFDQPRVWNDRAKAAGRIARVFCGSLCDILEDGMYISGPRQHTFAMVKNTPNLMWLFLTKRIENAADVFPSSWMLGAWPENAMLGFTGENEEWLAKRMHYAARLRADIPLFLSAEPLLGDLGRKNLRCLTMFKWVICGGESGPNARPMHPLWARNLRDGCVEADVPFLFKQWGSLFPTDQRDVENPEHWRNLETHVLQANGVTTKPESEDGWRCLNLELGAMAFAPVDKHRVGRLLDGVEHNALPAYWPANVGLLPKDRPLEVIS